MTPKARKKGGLCLNEERYRPTLAFIIERCWGSMLAHILFKSPASDGRQEVDLAVLSQLLKHAQWGYFPIYGNRDVRFDPVVLHQPPL